MGLFFTLYNLQVKINNLVDHGARNEIDIVVCQSANIRSEYVFSAIGDINKYILSNEGVRNNVFDTLGVYIHTENVALKLEHLSLPNNLY